VTAHHIGLIADTHGLVRPGVHEALAGVALILHAGDVGGDEVLDELSLIAPVLAVLGNTDDPASPRLVASLTHVAGPLRIHVSHGHETGSPTPAVLRARYPHDIIVYGHTHRALVDRTEGRLVVNPGAAGPARFDVAPSVARLTITGSAAEVEVVPLPD
jgi:putative phosphoesterase